MVLRCIFCVDVLHGGGEVELGCWLEGVVYTYLPTCFASIQLNHFYRGE
jgi:hypothetical protein